MLDRPKFNPPIDLVEVPRPGTVTAVSSGTAIVAPIEWLQQINVSGLRPGELDGFLEALRREREVEEAMAILDPDDTGISNTLWFVPAPEGQHGPRIKVAIDPPRAVRPGGVEATVPFDASKRAGGRWRHDAYRPMEILA
jgi:hypothetical protein